VVLVIIDSSPFAKTTRTIRAAVLWHISGVENVYRALMRFKMMSYSPLHPGCFMFEQVSALRFRIRQNRLTHYGCLPF